MAVTQIVCTNCGAKYKIPESFKGTRAKCKACGSVIDVAGQRAEASQESPAAAPAPAVAQPARAKPAAASASRPRRARDSSDKSAARAKAGETRSSRSGRSRTSGKRSSGGSRRRDRAGGDKQSGGKGMLIGGGLLVVALGIVGVIYMTGETDAPSAGDKVAMDAALEAKQANQELADQAKAAEAKAIADVAAAKEAEAVEATARQKEAKAAEAAAAKRKKGLPLSDASQVFNPKTELELVPWPESVTSEEVAAITEMVENLVNGGYAGTAAKKELAEVGYKALPALVNALREIDYLDSVAGMTGFEINQFLTRITFGTNVGYRVVDIGETVPLDTAHWNARIVATWRKFAVMLDNPASWEKLLKRNKKGG